MARAAGGNQPDAGSLSYTNVLARGYALVRDEAGRPVTRGASVKPGDRLAIQFADRSVDALAAKSKPAGRRHEAAVGAGAGSQGGQGTLL
jgi:exodeoxyribonuclease VII large subunit